MDGPMKINERHGDESEMAHRARKPTWIYALAAVVVLVGAIAMMMRAPTGPGSNTGRVASEAANVQAGVAPGVGSTYANQPGGTADGTPNPKLATGAPAPADTNPAQ